PSSAAVTPPSSQGRSPSARITPPSPATAAILSSLERRDSSPSGAGTSYTGVSVFQATHGARNFAESGEAAGGAGDTGQREGRVAEAEREHEARGAHAGGAVVVGGAVHGAGAQRQR
ncbi:hypothetical protein T484DRAFT_1902168, partial [Baffinella frigidus]